MQPARIFFIEMMGVPGSYDASVYDDLEDNDQEGRWFVRKYGGLPDISIRTRNVCTGEALPGPDETDAVVLAGSYNSVHDHTFWQQAVLAWFPVIRESRIPVLGICGSHQLLGCYFGAEVRRLGQGPYAGTFSTSLTEAGRASPLMEGIADGDHFHYANAEHVTEVPPAGVLLAHSGKVPVAALDFGGHWYSTQFHPESTVQSLGTIWRNTRPELCRNYFDTHAGDRLVKNFFRIVTEGAD
ncbi:MAG: type 1 glutamine amidotransferase [Gammaproteobacteria bacterium]|nr:type 1 glutamine amidotransferase [Gammaproteobacteria bacterium]